MGVLKSFLNFVRSDIGKMASKMAFLKPGQTKVC